MWVVSLLKCFNSLDVCRSDRAATLCPGLIHGHNTWPQYMATLCCPTALVWVTGISMCQVYGFHTWAWYLALYKYMDKYPMLSPLISGTLDSSTCIALDTWLTEAESSTVDGLYADLLRLRLDWHTYNAMQTLCVKSPNTSLSTPWAWTHMLLKSVWQYATWNCSVHREICTWLEVQSYCHCE